MAWDSILHEKQQKIGLKYKFFNIHILYILSLLDQMCCTEIKMGSGVCSILLHNLKSKPAFKSWKIVIFCTDCYITALSLNQGRQSILLAFKSRGNRSTAIIPPSPPLYIGHIAILHITLFLLFSYYSQPPYFDTMLNIIL